MLKSKNIMVAKAQSGIKSFFLVIVFLKKSQTFIYFSLTSKIQNVQSF